MLANVFVPPYTHLAAFLQASRSRMIPALTAVVAVTVTSISPIRTYRRTKFAAWMIGLVLVQVHAGKSILKYNSLHIKPSP